MESLDKNNIRKIAQTAKAYKETFAGQPWNEVSKGPGCGKMYPNSVGEPCPCGCGKLEEAYPLLKTTRYIKSEISKRGAIAKTVEEKGEVVAFGWGYNENGAQFASTKYDEMNNIETMEKIVGSDTEFFYMSEFGVIPEKQGTPEKIGSKITLAVAEEATKRGDSLLLRTLKSTEAEPSRMDGIASEKLGMTPIVGAEDQVQDPENPKRILYFKK